MLTARGTLSKNDLKKNIKDITSKHPDDLVYKIKKKELIVILLLPQKITSVTKISPINDFLSRYKKDHKIIIVKAINKKAKQYIINTYANSEIFLEEDLMINLIDHELVPKHQLLTPDEANKIYDAYNCKKKNLPRILHTDQIVKYYNMKPGDICRIIRPSITSGIGITYRLVVKGISKK